MPGCLLEAGNYLKCFDYRGFCPYIAKQCKRLHSACITGILLLKKVSCLLNENALDMAVRSN